ncbi:MAG: peptidoglycan DD-metalloendopeptidase family protein [Anaerolineae bacterium]|nr:peptidoglycan DD-metalloendopeptidase family protein [Anaerolineae bacterium]
MENCRGWRRNRARCASSRPSQGRLFCTLIFLALLAALGIALPVAADGISIYRVQPGDTLASIAVRFGTDTATLQHLNALQDPRLLYPGQTLQLPAQPGPVMLSWTPYFTMLGDSLDTLVQSAGLTWEEAALGNHLLNPGLLRVGQALYLPEADPAHVIAVVSAEDTRLAMALRYDLPYGVALRLNPQPLYAGALFLRPGDGASPRLPYPIVALNMTAQPVARGRTVALALETAIPSACTITFQDVTESCYTQDAGYATDLYAFIGIPPLLDPGAYDVTLHIQMEDRAVDVTLPLVVSSGRYDYERLDLPADRQVLLDPALSEHERVKVASLRGLRSAERLWEFPFRYPVQGAVTSYYGSRRSYGYGFGSYHAGTDFRVEIGDPVYAPASGVVILAEPLVVRGRAILIDHGWGIVTGYWHLSRIDVAVGQSVTQGETIGAVGNTGLSTGPHLHWELWVNGTSVSALQWVYGLAEVGLSADGQP